MKKFLCVVAALFIAAVSFAQNSSIKLTLVDSSTGETIPFATVSITPEGQTKASKYALTNDSGEATIENVKAGNYTFKAELLGYKAVTKDIKVEKSDLNLDKVKMDPDSEVLDAASVSAVGNSIIVKKDTVEYNAAAFRVTDNDALEDLLKKLPGVEVASDGSITANGKTISKITIDGKTFFLDDPTIASKNIPAKIVEKVKVVEKKSDQAQFTGIDDGEEETVIDLSIKPGMMKGWFGSVMGGGGHDLQEVGMANASWDDARWQTAAMVGRFTDKSQLSIIVNGNNTNNRGFNDMAGSMMNSMRGGGGMGGGGDMGGFGGQSNGITTSWLGGVNGSYTLLDGDVDLTGNYFYSGSKTDIKEKSYQETYQDDGTTLITDKDGYSSTFSNGHRIGVRYEHKFTEKTSILFEPQFSYNSGWYGQHNDNLIYNLPVDVTDTTAKYMSNKGYTDNTGVNNNWSTSGFLLFRQRLNKPGRTLSVHTRYSFSHNKLNAVNNSLNRIFATDSTWNDSNVNQYVDNKSNSSSINIRASYTEPLAEKLYLEAYYGYGWSRNKSTKDAYDLTDVIDSWKEIKGYDYSSCPLDSTYSNRILNVSQTHRVGANLQFQTEKLRLQIGASYQPTITDNDTYGHDPYHSVDHNWSPQAMIDWDINENADFRMFYRGRSSQPSTSQLIPVPDNSDPLNISFGNPYLDPYFSHNLRGMFGYTNKKTFFSIHGFYGAGLVQDGISNATWVNNGVTYAMPMNGGLTGNAELGFFMNAPFGQTGLYLTNWFNTSYSNSKSYVGRTAYVSDLISYYDETTAEFQYETFRSDVLNDEETFNKYFINNRTDNLNVTENLKLVYRNDFIEAGISGRTSFNKPWYTKEIIANQSSVQGMTFNNNVATTFQYNASFGLGLKTDLNYNWYVGYVTPQDDEWIWNAQISQLVCKNKITIALMAYDILNQSKNLYVTDSSNYHKEVRNNTLGRYILLTLTYRFGNFGEAGQQLDKRMRRGGPMGGPGGPGPRP